MKSFRKINKNNWRSKTKTSLFFKEEPEELDPIKDNRSDYIKKLLKYKEIFEELSNKRIGEIYNKT